MAHTSVETATNCRHYNLKSEKAAHPIKNGSILVVYGMDTVNMDEGGDRQEDSGTNRLE